MYDFIKSITKEDYETIIRKWLDKKSTHITKHSVAPLSDKVEGFLGDHYILTISALGNGKITEHRFFMKTLPSGPDTQIEIINNINGFEREASFFDHHVKEFERIIPGYKPSFAPKFVFNKSNKIVIFEDLSVKEYGVARTQYPGGLDLDHVKVALKALAKLHSSSLAYEEIRTKQSGKAHRIFTEDLGIYKEEHFINDNNFLIHLWVRSGVQGISALVDQLPQTGLTKQKLAELLNTCYDLVKVQSKFRRVLGHNDLWEKNILFKYTNALPVQAKIVDYQLSTYYPPVYDVVFLISLNVSKEVKERSFFGLLKFYHTRLSAELKKYDLNVKEILPFTEFMESMRFLFPAIKLKVALYRTMLCINENYMSVLTKDNDRFRELMFGDRGPICLELFKSDSYYREKLTSALLDLGDLILFGIQSWQED